jgi:hypothetical protein
MNLRGIIWVLWVWTGLSVLGQGPCQYCRYEKCLLIPQKTRNFLTGYAAISLSRLTLLHQVNLLVKWKYREAICSSSNISDNLGMRVDDWIVFLSFIAERNFGSGCWAKGYRFRAPAESASPINMLLKLVGCDVVPSRHSGVAATFGHGTQHLLYDLVFGCKSLSTSHTTRMSGTRDPFRRHSTHWFFRNL